MLSAGTWRLATGRLAPVVAALLMGLVGACAQQGAPPGGPDDRRPPVVIRTVPDTFEVVEDFRGPIRFEFDERISERTAGGTLDDAVVVSPRTGELRVGHGRRSLTIELDGGFRPGLVYRVTLLPVVRDLFNNQMRDPFEIVFSTGGEAVPTTIAGIAWDRVTGRGAANYQVRAVGTEDDSTVHVAVTDTGGVYAFRYIPAARYVVTAFDDRNRDAVVDPMEVQGSRRLLIDDGDTLLVHIAVLQPDTTPAVLTSATALDSVTLLLEFDDYLDPALPLAGVGVSLTSPDSSRTAAVRIFHEHEYVTYTEAVMDSLAVLDSLDAVAAAAARAAADTAVADTAAADTAAADTVSVADPSAEPTPVAPSDSLAGLDVLPGATPERGPVRRRGPPGIDGRPAARARGEEAERAGRRAAATGPDGERLPAQSIVALFAEPLVPNIAYQLTVTAVRNLFAIPLGGGEAAVALEPPPSADTTAVLDTTAVPDSTALPDTGMVVDTSSVRRRVR